METLFQNKPLFLGVVQFQGIVGCAPTNVPQWEILI